VKRPANRMGLEYLMAWLLLDKGQDSITTISTNLDLFRTAGYSSIPTHCQEAILLKERADQTLADLRGFRYEADAIAHVDEFLQDAAPYLGGQGPPEQMRALYGSTYLFYYFFVTTPRQPRRIAGASGRSGGTTRVE